MGRLSRLESRPSRASRLNTRQSAPAQRSQFSPERSRPSAKRCPPILLLAPVPQECVTTQGSSCFLKLSLKLPPHYAQLLWTASIRGKSLSEKPWRQVRSSLIIKWLAVTLEDCFTSGPPASLACGVVANLCCCKISICNPCCCLPCQTAGCWHGAQLF